MIITRTPFRISLFGGSTDYESYYSKHGSLLIGMAIDQYCHIALKKTAHILPFHSKISYSTIETVKDNKDIQHNGVRGVLKDLGIDYGVEISVFNDLPAQTGVGSSSSFVVGLFKACWLQQLGWENKDKMYNAHSAIFIERDLLKEPGGIQDQIWASYGGFNSIEIDKGGDFTVKPMPISYEFKREFLERSVLLYTGKTRNSFAIARSHDVVTDPKKKIHELATKAYDAFCNQNINLVGEYLHESWVNKQKISDKICNERVASLYDKAKKHGAIGGKLLGSGGEGFLYLILDHKTNKKDFLDNFSLQNIDFEIDENGSQIIYS